MLSMRVQTANNLRVDVSKARDDEFQVTSAFH